MSGAVNKVILIGNVGRDPESRTLQNGGKVVNFSMATTETWHDKASGEKKEKTQWHRIVIFNEGLGDVAERYVKKGAKIYISGAIETRKFTDKDGAERETTEIVLRQFRGELTMLGSKDDAGGEGRAPRSEGQAPAQRQATGGGERTRGAGWSAPPRDDLNDDIPF